MPNQNNTIQDTEQLVVDIDAVFKQIKKQNGEAFARLVRPFISSVENIVEILKYAGHPTEEQITNDMHEEILTYLSSYLELNIEEEEIEKSYVELLAEKGYDVIKVENEKDKNSIKKYFRKREELCTFRNPYRHEDYFIFYCIKKGVNTELDSDKVKIEQPIKGEPATINRPAFPGEEARQDDYGTSVISIQISKKTGRIFITNRYNHTVKDQDNTFWSNPDNIKRGLTAALAKECGIDISVITKKTADIPNGFVEVDKHLVYYDREIDNVYFSNDVYVKNEKIHEINKNTEILIDHFIFDMNDDSIFNFTTSKKTIHNILNEDDPFTKVLTEELKGSKKVQIVKEKGTGKRFIEIDGVKVVGFKNGRITDLNLQKTTEIGDCFLKHNQELESFVAPNLKKVGNNFLSNNRCLKKLEVPLLETIGNYFLERNNSIEKLDFPNLREVGSNFLCNNAIVEEFNAPHLEKTGKAFLVNAKVFKKLSLPSLKEVGSCFLSNIKSLKELEVPLLERVGDNFLSENVELEKLNVPFLKEVGNCFLPYAKWLTEFKAPVLGKMGDGCLSCNYGIKKLELPKLKKVGDGFLTVNEILTELEMPLLESVGDSFLTKNWAVKKLTFPKLKEVGDFFLEHVEQLSELEAPLLEKVGYNFLNSNHKLKRLSLPSLREIKPNFLCHNKILEEFELSSDLKQPEKGFLEASHPEIKKISRPTESSSLKYLNILYNCCINIFFAQGVPGKRITSHNDNGVHQGRH